ncbi:MAG: MerR family DNA-binding transcriptional regulator [Hormoscilla sp. GM7CHS1pb]|nr:MerR family DNA-binding transcriptional regulator [Hormoscilla sp. GM7CHS1pb]
MTHDYYTPAQAANALGVHPESLRRWEREGKIFTSYRTPGGQRRFLKREEDDLHRPVANQLVNKYKLTYLPTYQTTQTNVKTTRKIDRRQKHARLGKEAVRISHGGADL